MAAVSPADILAAACADHATRPALLAPDGARLATWSELGARVARLRGALATRGVRAGDRVAAWLPRGADEVALAWAVWTLGAVWVSIPRKSAPAQARWLAADAELALLVGDAQTCAAFGPPNSGARPVNFSELEAAGVLPVAAVADVVPDALAALAYTSGSTGLPKGVMITWRNLLDAAARVDAYLRHGASDRLVGLMPLNSPWGMLQPLLAARAGGAIVLPPAAMLPGELAGAIRAAGATGLAALPPTWTQLADWLVARGETLPGLRYVTTSGGVIPSRVWELMPKVFPRAEIFATYGLTEAFRTTVVPPEWLARKTGSLGRPCPGVDIALVTDGGQEAAAGESGELVHHGACVTAGYWRRPAQTAAAYAVRPEHAGLFSRGEPLHYSGDIVRRDADGFLWFVARRDAQIKTGGFRVSAEETEAALVASGHARQAVVFGMPDEVLGQVVVAVIEPAGEAEAARTGALAHARAVLANHQVPRAVLCRAGGMPLTANGKIDRPAVIADAQKALSFGL